MSKLGKDRGKRWERDVANYFRGERKWAGPGTDVELEDLGLAIECKSQADYDGLQLLKRWVEQAESYQKRWALAMRLGLRKHKRELILIPKEEYKRLLELERTHES